MLNLLLGSSIILGLLLFFVLLYYARKSGNSNNSLLAITILCTCYSLLTTFLNETGLILQYPALIRTGNITGYLIYPSLYLYTRNTFYPGKLFQKYDWIFLLPAFIYLVDLLPFMLSDRATKIAVMQENLNDRTKLFRVSEGWIGIKGFHFIFRYLWGLFIMIAQLSQLYKNRPLLNSDNPNNNELYNFVWMLTILFLPLLVPGIFGALFHLRWYSLQFISINLTIVIFSVGIFLIFSPHIVYGFFSPYSSMKKEKASNATIINPIEKDIQVRHVITDEELAYIQNRMNHVMVADKSYLNPRYSIHELAKDTGIPVYQLSRVLNYHFNSNFNNWINKYRVLHFEQLCQQPEMGDRTIDALAEESGFTNRTTLTNAFKKENNTTPGLYLKQFRMGQQRAGFS